jgi:hypothetical protein
MAIILKANKVNLFVSSVLFVFWYYSPNFLDTPRISMLQVGYEPAIPASEHPQNHALDHVATGSVQFNVHSFP